MPQRIALLVATYRYQDAGLSQLTAPGHDAEALAEVLRDTEIAGFDVTILVNEPHHVVGDAIGEFYHNRRRDDLTLLYFTGHGLKDDQGRLYLAMTNTKRDRLLFTGLSAQQIDEAMESCSSRQKVLVLDCCYSGAFPTGHISKSDPQVNALEKFQGKGRVVLTASDATQYSFEGNHIIGEGTRSVFTRFLVEGLTTGDADLDSDGDISLDELYSYVHDRVTEEMPQQRPKKQENVEVRIVIARNIHWSLPAHIRNAIESPVARERLAVVEGLAHLHRVGNDLVRAEVIDQIRRLTHDDSKAVSAAAMELITSLNPELGRRGAEEPAPRGAEEPRWGPPTVPPDPPPPRVKAQGQQWRAVVFARWLLRSMQVRREIEGRNAPTTRVRGPLGLSASWGLVIIGIILFVDGCLLTTISSLSDLGVFLFFVGLIVLMVGTVAVAKAVRRRRREAERRNATKTQAGGHIGPPDRWGLGRLTRHQMALAASVSLAIISLVVVLVVVVTSSVSTISVDTGPWKVAVTPDGRRAYVTNYKSNNVSVIDTESNVVTATISVDAAPEGVVVAPDGRHVYVVNSGSNSVSVIEIGTGGIVSAGLERFYGQDLAWGGCSAFATTPRDTKAYADPGLQCAFLEVPLDYAHPNGRTVKVGLLRRPASDRAHRIGSLVINPGGPGESGMSWAATLVNQVTHNDLGRRFDLVGFDPRGIGSSKPQILCLTPAERDAERLMNLGVDTSPAGVARTESQEKADDAKCASRTGTDVLANIGTREVVRDMDVMRSALGDQKLTYLGNSYGTLVGTSYAEAFPDSVRAMIFDGAVDPAQDPISYLIDQARALQQGFDAFAGWCAGLADCALGQDKSQAVKAFHDRVLPLIDHPLSVSDGRKLSYTDATMGVIQALYQPNSWPTLNHGVQELAQGRGDTLMYLADMYYERLADGTYSTDTDAFQTVTCVDNPPIKDPKVARDVDAQYRAVVPFLDTGRQPSPALDNCAFWPVPPTLGPHHPQLTGYSPVMVISTTQDPNTPYQAGVNLAREINGRLLTFEGVQHTAFLQNIGCVDDAGIAYLVDLKLPPEGTRCKPAG